nr:hypothetical protein BaRGS_017405 [Batillaria attramentaria]
MDVKTCVSLFVVWLYRLRVPLFTTPGICHVTVFLTYVCGCLSVWFVVVVTAENFVRLVKPGLVFKYCRVDKAKRIVAAITVASALIYNFSLWTTGVMKGPDGTLHCTSYEEYGDIVMAVTIIDTALTLILPSIIMFFLIVTVVVKSMEAFERKQRLRGSAVSNGQRKRLTPEGKMTTFLFAISVIFLILNLPTHAIRLKMLIRVYVQKQAPSYADHILQRVFEILLYFNFSTNCIIYLTCGERFRQVFTSMYLSRFYQKDKITNENCTEGTNILMSRKLEREDDSACLTCLNELNDTESNS